MSIGNWIAVAFLVAVVATLMWFLVGTHLWEAHQWGPAGRQRRRESARRERR